MKRLDTEEERRLLSGLSSDDGGGGTGSGLLDKLKGVTRVKQHPRLATCSLHGLSLILSNPVKNLMGLGGIKNHTPIQLFFVCYYLQEEHELDTWKGI